MSINTIHIICLDQPYPAIYGGAIDMYYKIKALHKAGVKIILHVFLYRDDKTIPQIEKYAEKTYYYKRKLGVKYFLSLTPYIVYTRSDNQLLLNLLKDEHPILFEGLHTCFFLSDKRLRNRVKMVRAHNIEHSYYCCLAKYPNPLWKKLYYYIESIKLKRFEDKLKYSDRILAISEADTGYFKQKFLHSDVRLLNCFFDDSIYTLSQKPKVPYVLYQGNLSVAENSRAVLYILQEIVPKTKPDVEFIIAGANPSDEIRVRASQYDNVKVIANPDNLQMSQLIINAHINLLLTFQSTGIKLKLLTALYQGRGFCIVNKTMVEGNALAKICIQASYANDIVSAIEKQINTPISEEIIKERREYIHQLGYNNIENIIR